MTSSVNQEEILNAKLKLGNVARELEKKVTGQDKIIHNLIVCLVAQGHALIEGMPGLAKTLIAKSLAKVVEVPFSRVQFTPDLLPADIIGNVVYNPRLSEFETRKGPVFTGIFLADEINRAPAKVQSALLQAMEEKIITIGDSTFTLPLPFMVMATENPIDQEGTYQLPEAQMDRFLMKIMIGYPGEDEELNILRQHGSSVTEELRTVITGAEVLEISSLVEQIHVEERLRKYIVDLVRYTRPATTSAEISGFIAYGASPRASLALLKASRVNALLAGRNFVIPEDILDCLLDVLRHRIILSFDALSEDLQVEAVIGTIRDSIKIP